MAIRIWELWPEVTKAVYGMHKHCPEAAKRGHDFDHALRVGQLSLLFALIEQRTGNPDFTDEAVARQAGLAGLCHNADRVLQAQAKQSLEKSRERDSGMPDVSVESLVRSQLMSLTLEECSEADRVIIIDVCLKHSEINDGADSPALVAVKDADRVINASADWVMRNALYLQDKPMVNPYGPGDVPQNIFQPPSALQGVFKVLEWEEDLSSKAAIRLASARCFAESRFQYLREYVAQIVRQRREEGVLEDYPRFD